jgi:hypothetical protein
LSVFITCYVWVKTKWREKKIDPLGIKNKWRELFDMKERRRSAWLVHIDNNVFVLRVISFFLFDGNS